MNDREGEERPRPGRRRAGAGPEGGGNPALGGPEANPAGATSAPAAETGPVGGGTAAEVLGGVIAALGVSLDLEGHGPFAAFPSEAEAVRSLLVKASPARMGVIAAAIAGDAGVAAPARVSAAKLALECWEQVARAILTGGLAPPAPAPAPAPAPVAVTGTARPTHTEEGAEGLD